MGDVIAKEITTLHNEPKKSSQLIAYANAALIWDWLSIQPRKVWVNRTKESVL